MDDTADALNDEIKKLREQLTLVSQEKLRLQFVLNIMADVAKVRGLDNMARHAVKTVMDAIGGLNVCLYYMRDGDWYYSDMNRISVKVDCIDNQLVAEALFYRRFVESKSVKTKDLRQDTDGPDALENTWVFPLIAGDDLIGALEMRGRFFAYSDEMKQDLQVAVSYLSLALNNEIVNSSNLRKAYEALKQETRKLEAEVEERKIAERENDRFEAKLRQSQKMEAMGTLAGGIAHDFNNILFPLIGYTEMLQQDFSHEKLVMDRASKILKAAFRARDLVKQILTFSRQHPQELQPVRIHSIVNECLKLLEASIPKTIRIETKIDSDCGLVIADPTEIHQIIINLATNAYHAMPPSGGEMKILLERTDVPSQVQGFSELTPGGYVVLKIIDNGHGIERSVIDKIFDPYFTTKSKDRGTGLGLSVVQGIVKNCKGRVHVYSEPGKGTEVHVYLPRMEGETDDKSSERSLPFQGGCERILLVDDEIAVLKMEQLMLERLGYLVTPQNGSLQALEAFNAGPEQFDLVITDMTMPIMTGDKLSKALRRIRPEIPILICTGFSEYISKEKAEALGIGGFLLKPVGLSTFAHKIREVIKKARDANTNRA